MVAGNAHHQRGQAEAHPLGRPADQQPREGQWQHGQRAACDHDPERGEDRLAAA
jgi:hypothetical protein